MSNFDVDLAHKGKAIDACKNLMIELASDATMNSSVALG